MAVNKIHDPKMHPTLFHDLIMIFITYLPRDTVHEVQERISGLDSILACQLPSDSIFYPKTRIHQLIAEF